MATISPIHPGEVLMEEFLEPLGITQHRLAVSIGVPPRRINEIVHGKRSVTADTALRLARGPNPQRTRLAPVGAALGFRIGGVDRIEPQQPVAGGHLR